VALFEKARVDKIPKHDPAHLSVEACHLSGVGGGELDTRPQHEQTLDTCERFVETPCLEWLRHLALLLTVFWRYWGERDSRRGKPFVDVCGESACRFRKAVFRLYSIHAVIATMLRAGRKKAGATSLAV
jgi:hypothetical protein